MRQTMKDASACFISFILRGSARTHFALDSLLVDRIVHLPALTDVPDAPPYLAGVFDLAGTLIPVLSLSAILNRPRQPYSTSDSVIVLHGSGNPFGILVHEVIDVCGRPQSGVRAVTPGLDGKDRGIAAEAFRLE